jgi:hypothetical protein
MTKVEGAVFVILCVALLVPWSRSENRRRLLSVAAIPALTLVGWLFYSWKHGMSWAYGRQPYGALTLKFSGSAS